MKILMLTHEFSPFIGGISTYCSELAHAACQRGHAVTVIAPNFHADTSEYDLTLPYKVKRFTGGVFTMRNLWRVLREVIRIKRGDYDIIHAADWPFVLALYLLYPVKKLPYIATAHGTDVLGFTTSRVARLLRAKSPYSRSSFTIGNSAYTAGLVKQHNPSLPKDRISYAHLGVNSWWETPAENASSVLIKYGIDNNKKILLTVARLDERKGHTVVLEGLALLSPDEKKQVTYVIVGGGGTEEYCHKIDRLAKECGVPVVMTGKIPSEDIKALYATSWLYCMAGIPFPGRIEGFGLVYLEAASQGLPSIATDLGGVPEVVINEQTGVLLREATPHSFAKELSYLLKEPDRVVRFAESAFQHAKRFTWDLCAQQTYETLSAKQSSHMS